ncbi:MAG TPA: LysM peptidoglycan-binding domain-containing M23 family metallopeptidase [Methylomirabilota bacterium]|nr:LysM peptidoglycan-binding domain-containing M23 family metallopeptidase [Methylomirabilota bacterium]
MKRPLYIAHATFLSFSFLSACATRVGAPTPQPARPGPGVYHVVRAGENLYRIGKAYDVPFQELARINGIRDPGQIRVGQKVYIPGAARQLPVAIITPAEAPGAPPGAQDEEDATSPGLLLPVSGTINSGFGPRGGSFHDGVDIAAPEGTPIRAIAAGEVIYSDQLRGYGNIVILRHEGGIVSVYAHNQVNLVREGQRVFRGEEIAKVGSTGRVSGPHLHFEIRKNNAARDPLQYLPQLCCLPASDMVAPKS